MSVKIELVYKGIASSVGKVPSPHEKNTILFQICLKPNFHRSLTIPSNRLLLYIGCLKKLDMRFNCLPIGDAYTMPVAKAFKIRQELRLYG